MTDSTTTNPMDSTPARARAEDIRAAALREVARRGRRHRARRSASLLALASIVALLTLRHFHQARAQSRAPAERRATVPNAPVAGPASPTFSLVQWIADDPRVMERAAIKPEALVQRIDDDELLRLLDEVGMPAGIVRIGGSFQLVDLHAQPEAIRSHDETSDPIG